MDQSVLSGQDLDEGAEVQDANHLARVYLAGLGLPGQRFDHVDGLLGRLPVDRADEHRAVVLHVHRGIGLLHDAAYRLAAGADDRADLVHGDGDAGQPGGVVADVRARAGYGLRHAVEDGQPGFLGLGQGLLYDLEADVLDLDVQLDGGYALSRAGHLEVHVSDMIFHALNVRQGLEATVLAGHQTD